LPSLAAPPATIRDVFELFARYERPGGIAAMLDGIDWQAAAPGHWRKLIVGAQAGSAQASDQDPMTASDRIAAFLSSPEFANRLLLALPRAYPEKRRLMMVHIPKCAGTDLISRLSPLYPTLSRHVMVLAGEKRADLFRHLHEFVVKASTSDTIFLTGHVPLTDYLPLLNANRTGDRLFTIVRDPIDLVLSGTNFLLRQMTSPEVGRAGARKLRATFGVRPNAPLSADELRALAVKIMRHPEISKGNTLCRFLGGETAGVGSAKSALDALVRSDIEITDVSRYGDWLRSEWGIVSTERRNATERALDQHGLEPADLAYINDLTAEDRRLYDRIRTVLARDPATSVRGRAVAAAAG